ncbi:MAG: DUF2851 family protein, partial [Candidatus Cloacimonetes bacterium]|nr:DUF2851 family protein [Candidatus Cloacimonadota bacterium]
MEERFLYHIWDEGHLTPDLRCISRKDLRVVYQGQFNTGRGPDFKNAIIELAGEQLRGDIEIHLKTTDWQCPDQSRRDDGPGRTNRVLLVGIEAAQFAIARGKRVVIGDRDRMVVGEIGRQIVGVAGGAGGHGGIAARHRDVDPGRPVGGVIDHIHGIDGQRAVMTGQAKLGA